MITISSARPAAIAQPVRRMARSRSWPSIQASASANSAIESENFIGLNQSGAPTRVRWSTTASPAVDERERRHACGEPVEAGVAPAGVGEQCAHRIP